MMTWGSIDDFDGSMAAAIEAAFAEVWGERGLDPLPANPDPDERDNRRMLYLAIARGVIKHLKANPDSFAVSVDLGIFGVINATVTIGGAET
jgi:hypothetical protein